MRIRLYLSLFVLCAVTFAEPAAADMYKYVDELGVCHYSNVPDDKRFKLHFKSAPKPLAKQTQTGFVRGAAADESLTRQFVKHRSTSTGSYDFENHIQRAARAHKVDPMLIKAIIKTESDFNPYAVSSKGAQGLMQLMPGTASYLKVKDPFDAGQNINGGTRYIRRLLDSYKGDIRLSLAAYNAGPSRVKKTIPRFPETVNYVSKVMRRYNEYRGVGAAGTSINVRQLVTIN